MTQLGLEPRPLIIGHWVSHLGLRVVNEFSWHSYHNNVNWRHDYSNSDNDNDDESKSTITKITDMIQYFFGWFDVLRLTSEQTIIIA